MSSDARQAVPVSAPSFNPRAVLRRRWGAMLFVFTLVLVAAVFTAFLWPPTYVSTATILIEQQELPPDLVRTTISSYADQRIQVISQRVMTTENLLRIVTKYDLYAKERKSKGREAIIEKLRKDISRQTISEDVIDPKQGRPVQATIAFSLGYSSRSPDIAARVANELWSLFQQENLKSRKQITEDASSFFIEASEKHRANIAALESRIAEFKSRHVENLPEHGGLNIQLLNRADDDRRSIDAGIAALDQQILYLDAQLAQISKEAAVYTSTGERVMSGADRLKVLRSEEARVSANHGADWPELQRLRREIAGLEAAGVTAPTDNDRARQLTEAQAELVVARQRYGSASEHPEVRRLERLVTTLSATPAVTPQAAKSADPPDNPAYIQIRAQREATVNQRGSLLRQREDLAARVVDLEGRLASSPGIERDFAALLRDMENEQIAYREARQKQVDAQLAQNLEEGRKGERFTLIEPPLAPEEPTSPNRKLLLGLGVVLALALAGGMAALLEFLDSSIRGRQDLANLLTVPPLAVIPWIENAAARAGRVRRRRLALAGSLASLVMAVVAVHWFYRPLDVLWAVVMRRLGA
jgi:uncharacterized protein involved in exopolysaccharide biosynthesis